MKKLSTFLSGMILMLLSIPGFSQSNVTFSVDMAQYTGLNDTVYVNGTWNNWCGKCNPLTKDANSNVWSATLPIPNGTHEFKYTIGGWNAQETLTSGLPCTVTNSGFTNRTLSVSGALTLPTVCWQSCTTCTATSQQVLNLPITFDSTGFTYVLTDFGGNSSVVGNDPVDSSNKVGVFTKTNTAETWAGTTFGTASGLGNAIPFAQNATKITMKVYSPDSGIVIRLKAEDANDGTKSVETDARTTVANAWHTITFDFANQATGTAALNLTYTYKKLSVFFNFGTSGSSAGTKVYYADDIAFVAPTGPSLTQVKLPITFDEANVDYTVIDFGGAATTVDFESGTSGNKVAITSKPTTAETWAGTTTSTTAGLAQAIPFAAGQTKMKVKVLSPDSGIVVRLKAENASDPTKSVETDARTTVANAWEDLEFDFANQSQGTAAINFATVYNKLSIFFNFGKNGASEGNKTYKWDDVRFTGGGTQTPPKVNVTFSVDARSLPLGPNDKVTLNGTFNNWCGECAQMTNVPNTKIWTITLPLDTNTEYEYKYTVGNWVIQENLAQGSPCTKTSGNFTNRVIKTGTSNATLDVVCWESCLACAGTGPVKTNVTFRVDMSKYNLAPEDTVTLNGSFNGWCGKCTPMTKEANSSIWSATLLLDKDSSYEYKYVIGDWKVQESLKEGSACTVTNFGFTNRFLKVTNLNDTLPVVCWESCVSCANTAPKAKVTFRVNMKNYVGDLTSGVTLNGSFNNWCGSCAPMTSIGGNIYSLTLSLDTGEYPFKFTIGNWEDQEQFNTGDPCTKTEGTFVNRIMRVTDTAAVLVGPYCWNTCTLCDAVGTEENVLANLSVYPNPASENILVDLGKVISGKSRIAIYDLSGKEVMSQNYTDTESLRQLDIKALNKGLYLLKVEAGSWIKTVKVLVD
ncbi:MAG: T9SS type A sorting domain-containing protein [Bacteroidetes bacterium]|nr:T9SS type A sorting domain-containing protein [Bacteroidota bacterium]